MLGAGDAMKQVTSKRTVCSNSSSKTLGEDSKETLTAITTITKEAAVGIKGTRDKVR